eukprot:augustus_masked-scaffold_42-processed-gene-1.2-mRNA-1 protein AED:1.00 eAED:1.00 QI:0/-1/0/0/-1/1/1/0/403
MSRIFLEHPLVEKRFKSHVPSLMSESEFWTLFVYSKFNDYKIVSESLSVSKEQRVLEKKAADLFEEGKEKEKRIDAVEKPSVELYNVEKVRGNLEIQVVDPDVDLVATMYDNIGLFTEDEAKSLMSTGLAERRGKGLIHRDELNEKLDERVREELKKQRLQNGSGSKLEVEKKLVENLQGTSTSAALFERYNNHSEVVLEAGLNLGAEGLKKRMKRLEGEDEDFTGRDLRNIRNPEKDIISLNSVGGSFSANQEDNGELKFSKYVFSSKIGKNFLPKGEKGRNSFEWFSKAVQETVKLQEEIRKHKKARKKIDKGWPMVSVAKEFNPPEEVLLLVDAIEELRKEFWSISKGTKKGNEIKFKLAEVYKQLEKYVPLIDELKRIDFELVVLATIKRQIKKVELST